MAGVLLQGPGIKDWRGPYIEEEELPADAWGRQFRYRVVDGKPIIDSAGPDGNFGTDDDNGNNVSRTTGCSCTR